MTCELSRALVIDFTPRSVGVFTLRNPMHSGRPPNSSEEPATSPIASCKRLRIHDGFAAQRGQEPTPLPASQVSTLDQAYLHTTLPLAASALMRDRLPCRSSPGKDRISTALIV